jgi:hypothetical protein
MTRASVAFRILLPLVMVACSSSPTQPTQQPAVGSQGTASSGSESVSSSGANATGSGGSNAPSSGGAVSGSPSATTPPTTDEAGTASNGDGGADDAGGGLVMSQGAPQDNAETDYTQTKTVTMDSFNVPANSEVFYCQSVANPWGKQVDIKTYDLTMSEGSHHMFAFYKDNATNAAAVTCPSGGLTFGAFTFVSQTPTVVQTFPATVGATLPKTTGFNMMVHYLNTGTTALTAHVSITMYVAKPNVVTNHAGVIFLNNIAMSVPATGQPVVSTASMKLNQAVDIMLSASHMHKFATDFTATVTPPGGAAQTLYTTKQWDEPRPTAFPTPLHLPSGTNFTWSCTDVNTTASTLTFGEYAEKNVMCISVSIFYPVQDITNPVLGSAIGGF